MKYLIIIILLILIAASYYNSNEEFATVSTVSTVPTISYAAPAPTINTTTYIVPQSTTSNVLQQKQKEFNDYAAKIMSNPITQSLQNNSNLNDLIDNGLRAANLAPNIFISNKKFDKVNATQINADTLCIGDKCINTASVLFKQLFK
jgi:hypothetical protein